MPARAAGPWQARVAGYIPQKSARGTSVRPDRDPALNLPNLITLARIIMVPVVVWAIASRQMQIAFLLFLAAGVSDAVDGFIAKRFNMASELGAHLDPLADKTLIVSIYVALGITEAIPRWIVILVVSRDILIVGGVMLAWFLGEPMTAQASAGLQAQYRGADRVRLPGAGLARIRLRRRARARDRADVGRRRIDADIGRLLHAGVGAPHECRRHRRLNGLRQMDMLPKRQAAFGPAAPARPARARPAAGRHPGGPPPTGACPS